MSSKENQKKKAISDARKLSSLEQETTVYFTEKNQDAEVYSASPELMSKLNALCKDYPEEYKCVDGDDAGLSYKVKRKCILFAKPKEYTVEDKKRRAEQMVVNRKDRKGGGMANGNRA
jgi:hypothetical protein